MGHMGGEILKNIDSILKNCKNRANFRNRMGLFQNLIVYLQQKRQ